MAKFIIAAQKKPHVYKALRLNKTNLAESDWVEIDEPTRTQFDSENDALETAQKVDPTDYFTKVMEDEGESE